MSYPAAPTRERMDIVTGKQTAGSSSQPIYDMALRTIAAWSLPRSARVADVGGGKGAFAAQLLNVFDNIDIIDHEPSSVPAQICYLTCDLNGPWAVADSSYDAIASLEVIEHLENPRHFMREISRALKPGGRAFITTPNQLSLNSKISLLLRNHFRDFSDNCYPAHITALLRIDLLRIAKETGLKVDAFAYTNSGRMPFTRHRWQQLVPFLKGQAFSDNIGMVVSKPGAISS